jgi:hypothetical protein
MASYNQFNYNYRPAKAMERKLFIELLKEMYGITGLATATYIGLGSIFFSDFRLVHKELGISKMINIELNKADQERFEYNKPYACIELLWGMSTDVLPTLDWEGTKIIWLDYDGSLKKYMIEDVEIIFSTLQPDSFYFVTCNSSMQRFYSKQLNKHDEQQFVQEFGNYSPFGLTSEMLTNKNSPLLIREILNSQIKHTIDLRNAAILEDSEKLIYIQLLLISYQDGAPMFSTGGVLKRKKDLRKFVRESFMSLPYIRTGEEILDIESPILTNSEINLINAFLPNKVKTFMTTRELQFIPETAKERYYNLYRYYPSFVEIRDF